jgi:hypothetical protein
MNTWNLEGMQVEGLYLGEIPVTGKVHLSRVKYGGEISHHIQLNTPVSIYGVMRDAVILEHKFVTACNDLNHAYF